jgi:hypothetical protein
MFALCKLKSEELVYALGAFALARSKSECFFLLIPLNVLSIAISYTS